jgi:apoptosis-inducing factor 1
LEAASPEPVIQETIAPVAPPFSQYVLVGAGTASYSALEAIRSKDPQAQILIIGQESHSPYQRPPLSKELWASDDAQQLMFADWQGNNRSVYYESDGIDCIPNVYSIPSHLFILDYYTVLEPSTTLTSNDIKSEKVHFLPQSRVVKVDTDAQLLTLENGSTVQYGKVLFATGASPKS